MNGSKSIMSKSSWRGCCEVTDADAYTNCQKALLVPATRPIESSFELPKHSPETRRTVPSTSKSSACRNEKSFLSSLKIAIAIAAIHAICIAATASASSSSSHNTVGNQRYPLNRGKVIYKLRGGSGNNNDNSNTRNNNGKALDDADLDEYINFLLASAEGEASESENPLFRQQREQDDLDDALLESVAALTEVQRQQRLSAAEDDDETESLIGAAAAAAASASSDGDVYPLDQMIDRLVATVKDEEVQSLDSDDASAMDWLVSRLVDQFSHSDDTDASFLTDRLPFLVPPVVDEAVSEEMEASVPPLVGSAAISNIRPTFYDEEDEQKVGTETTTVGATFAKTTSRVWGALGLGRQQIESTPKEEKTEEVKDEKEIVTQEETRGTSVNDSFDAGDGTTKDLPSLSAAEEIIPEGNIVTDQNEEAKLEKPLTSSEDQIVDETISGEQEAGKTSEDGIVLDDDAANVLDEQAESQFVEDITVTAEVVEVVDQYITPEADGAKDASGTHDTEDDLTDELQGHGGESIEEEKEGVENEVNEYIEVTEAQIFEEPTSTGEPADVEDDETVAFEDESGAEADEEDEEKVGESTNASLIDEQVASSEGKAFDEAANEDGPESGEALADEVDTIEEDDIDSQGRLAEDNVGSEGDESDLNMTMDEAAFAVEVSVSTMEVENNVIFEDDDKSLHNAQGEDDSDSHSDIRENDFENNTGESKLEKDADTTFASAQAGASLINEVELSSDEIATEEETIKSSAEIVFEETLDVSNQMQDSPVGRSVFAKTTSRIWGALGLGRKQKEESAQEQVDDEADPMDAQRPKKDDALQAFSDDDVDLEQKLDQEDVELVSFEDVQTISDNDATESLDAEGRMGSESELKEEQEMTSDDVVRDESSGSDLYHDSSFREEDGELVSTAPPVDVDGTTPVENVEPTEDEDAEASAGMGSGMGVGDGAEPLLEDEADYIAEGLVGNVEVAVGERDATSLHTNVDVETSFDGDVKSQDFVDEVTGEDKHDPDVDKRALDEVPEMIPSAEGEVDHENGVDSDDATFLTRVSSKLFGAFGRRDGEETPPVDMSFAPEEDHSIEDDVDSSIKESDDEEQIGASSTPALAEFLDDDGEETTESVVQGAMPESALSEPATTETEVNQSDVSSFNVPVGISEGNVDGAEVDQISTDFGKEEANDVDELREHDLHIDMEVSNPKQPSIVALEDIDFSSVEGKASQVESVGILDYESPESNFVYDDAEGGEEDASGSGNHSQHFGSVDGDVLSLEQESDQTEPSDDTMQVMLEGKEALSGAEASLEAESFTSVRVNETDFGTIEVQADGIAHSRASSIDSEEQETLPRTSPTFLSQVSNRVWGAFQRSKWEDQSDKEEVQSDTSGLVSSTHEPEVADENQIATDASISEDAVRTDDVDTSTEQNEAPVWNEDIVSKEEDEENVLLGHANDVKAISEESIEGGYRSEVSDDDGPFTYKNIESISEDDEINDVLQKTSEGAEEQVEGGTATDVSEEQRSLEDVLSETDEIAVRSDRYSEEQTMLDESDGDGSVDHDDPDALVGLSKSENLTDIVDGKDDIKSRKRSSIFKRKWGKKRRKKRKSRSPPTESAPQGQSNIPEPEIQSTTYDVEDQIGNLSPDPEIEKPEANFDDAHNPGFASDFWDAQELKPHANDKKSDRLLPKTDHTAIFKKYYSKSYLNFDDEGLAGEDIDDGVTSNDQASILEEDVAADALPSSASDLVRDVIDASQTLDTDDDVIGLDEPIKDHERNLEEPVTERMANDADTLKASEWAPFNTFTKRPTGLWTRFARSIARKVTDSATSQDAEIVQSIENAEEPSGNASDDAAEIDLLDDAHAHETYATGVSDASEETTEEQSNDMERDSQSDLYAAVAEDIDVVSANEKQKAILEQDGSTSPPSGTIEVLDHPYQDQALEGAEPTEDAGGKQDKDSAESETRERDTATSEDSDSYLLYGVENGTEGVDMDMSKPDVQFDAETSVVDATEIDSNGMVGNISDDLEGGQSIELNEIVPGEANDEIKHDRDDAGGNASMVDVELGTSFDGFAESRDQNENEDDESRSDPTMVGPVEAEDLLATVTVEAEMVETESFDDLKEEDVPVHQHDATADGHSDEEEDAEEADEAVVKADSQTEAQTEIVDNIAAAEKAYELAGEIAEVSEEGTKEQAKETEEQVSEQEVEEEAAEEEVGVLAEEVADEAIEEEGLGEEVAKETAEEAAEEMIEEVAEEEEEYEAVKEMAENEAEEMDEEVAEESVKEVAEDEAEEMAGASVEELDEDMVEEEVEEMHEELIEEEAEEIPEETVEDEAEESIEDAAEDEEEVEDPVEETEEWAEDEEAVEDPVEETEEGAKVAVEYVAEQEQTEGGAEEEEIAEGEAEEAEDVTEEEEMAEGDTEDTEDVAEHVAEEEALPSGDEDNAGTEDGVVYYTDMDVLVDESEVGTVEATATQDLEEGPRMVDRYKTEELTGIFQDSEDVLVEQDVPVVDDDDGETETGDLAVETDADKTLTASQIEEVVGRKKSSRRRKKRRKTRNDILEKPKNPFYRFLLANKQGQLVMFLILITEWFSLYLSPIAEGAGDLKKKTVVNLKLLATRGGGEFSEIGEDVNQSSKNQGAVKAQKAVTILENRSKDDDMKGCFDTDAEVEHTNGNESTGEQPNQSNQSETDGNFPKADNLQPNISVPRVRPNRLYRALLTRGRVGHILIMESVMTVEWVKVYLPTLSYLLGSLFRSVLIGRQNHEREDYALSSKTTGFVSSDGSAVRGGKKRKAQTRKADQRALHQLKGIGDVRQARYQFVSNSFMKRHRLGQYGLENSNIASDLVEQDSVDLRLRPVMAKDADDSDTDWVVKALVNQDTPCFKKSPSLGTSFGVAVGPSGPSVNVEFEIGLGAKRKKKRRKIVSQSAWEAPPPIKKAIGPRVSDRDSGVLGMIRSAGANSLVGRSLLGAYPGDAPSPGESASAKGLVDMARKYGYGDWSDDDVEEEEPELPRSKRRRRQAAPKSSSAPKERKKKKKSGSSIGIAFDSNLMSSRPPRTAARMSTRRVTSKTLEESIPGSPILKSTKVLDPALKDLKKKNSSSNTSITSGHKEMATKTSNVSKLARSRSVRPATEILREAKSKSTKDMNDDGN